jgi:hypothetical protein
MYKSTGIGIINAARNPNNVLAHCICKLLYMAGAKSGNPAAANDLNMVWVAMAVAGLKHFLSVKDHESDFRSP